MLLENSIDDGYFDEEQLKKRRRRIRPNWPKPVPIPPDQKPIRLPVKPIWAETRRSLENIIAM